MFSRMQEGLATRQFERNKFVGKTVADFLHKFDAIFTLNQDLLLEKHYQSGVLLIGDRRFDSARSPHMLLVKPADAHRDNPTNAARAPDGDGPYTVQPRTQPYFKLHGSMNWYDKAGGRLLIMGGNKAAAISSNPLLNWYAHQFGLYLNKRDARLMIIGYGFADQHINEMLLRATANGLKMFIIDPRGVDILDRRPKPGIPGPPIGLMAMQPNIIGASRRSLMETFGGDDVEHSRVMRFFERS